MKQTGNLDLSNNHIYRLMQKIKLSKDKELITLIKKLIDERNYLLEIADIDPLTGLNNRRILDRVRNYSGVLIFDVDNFKDINDLFGHAVGDMVLKQIAKVLKSNSRIVDSVCRIGGDEFVIIFINCPKSTILERGEIIRQGVQESTKNIGCNVTISIGAAFNDGTQEIEELINCADKALYESKNNGKNQIKRFYKKKKSI